MNKQQILKDFRKRFIKKSLGDMDIIPLQRSEELEQFISTLVDQVRAEALKDINNILDLMPHGAIYEANRYDTDDRRKIHLWIKESYLKAKGIEGISFDIDVPKKEPKP